MKKKVVIIGIVVLFVVVMIYPTLYITQYMLNNDEIVYFGDSIKVNIDKNMSIVTLDDKGENQIIGKAHITFEGEGKEDEQMNVSKIKISGNELLNIEGSSENNDCIASMSKTGKNIDFEYRIFITVIDYNIETDVKVKNNLFILYISKDGKFYLSALVADTVEDKNTNGVNLSEKYFLIDEDKISY